MKGLLTAFFLISFFSTFNGKEIQNRIIGGEVAPSGLYPFTAAITVSTDTTRFFCSGALISSEWILTVAHCVDGAVLFTIQLGSSYLTEVEENRVTLVASTYVMHPQYNQTAGLLNDIALIKLRLPVQFNDFIQAATLPTSALAAEEVVVALGWGQQSDFDSALSEQLRWVSLMTVRNIECWIYYGNSQVGEDKTCVIGSFKEGPCIGDSGAPLVKVYGENQMILVGVLSFLSYNGCENSDPAGYTRTQYFVNWIANVTNTAA